VNASTERRSETLAKEWDLRNRLGGRIKRCGVLHRLIMQINALTGGAYRSICTVFDVLSEPSDKNCALR
jgi:hypothetical protein